MCGTTADSVLQLALLPSNSAYSNGGSHISVSEGARRHMPRSCRFRRCELAKSAIGHTNNELGFLLLDDGEARDSSLPTPACSLKAPPPACLRFACTPQPAHQQGAGGRLQPGQI